METKRLNKTIAETGYCSRRFADKLIKDGAVKVNEKIAELGMKVNSADRIFIFDQIVSREVKNIYLLFNKPIGIVCTTDIKIRNNIITYLKYPERIFPIGRLDKQSEGLIFMTNDGNIVNKILRSKNNHEKEYIVRVDKKITASFIDKMSNGVHILDTITKPCKVHKLSDYTFNIVLTQGLNRQIRRMCAFFDYEVQTLKRTRIMNISLGNLKNGKYRSFTESELQTILNLVKDSNYKPH